jgi:hypothetical protein
MRVKLQIAAVLLLILTSSFSLTQYWHSTVGVDKDSDALDAWAARLEPARRALPIKRGVIGYLGQWDLPEINYDYADQEGEFILTQYALAPLILVRGAQEEWNIAVLNPTAFEAWQESNPGEYEIIEFKYGVYLLHRLNEP